MKYEMKTVKNGIDGFFGLTLSTVGCFPWELIGVCIVTWVRF